MFKKLVKAVVLGTVAAVAYYTYKNRNKDEEKIDDENIVHFIDEPKEEVTEEKAVETEKKTKSTAKQSVSETNTKTKEKETTKKAKAGD